MVVRALAGTLPGLQLVASSAYRCTPSHSTRRSKVAVAIGKAQALAALGKEAIALFWRTMARLAFNSSPLFNSTRQKMNVFTAGRSFATRDGLCGRQERANKGITVR
jgi:hypothetical protein